MKQLLWITAAIAVTLGLVAVAVGPGRDTTTLVSPPEAVAEEFVRKLAAGRYDRAVEHLDDQEAGQAMVTVQGQSLRNRAGGVNRVDGEPGAIEGDTATASTRIQTSGAGELEWHFTLVRRTGVWKIADWMEQ